jgi:hypothetical protein
MSVHFAVTHSHPDSVLALRIFFSVCLVILIFAGLYIFSEPGEADWARIRMLLRIAMAIGMFLAQRFFGADR